MEHSTTSSNGIELLKEHFYSKGFSAVEIEFLSTSAEEISTPPNTTLTRQFENAQFFYLLVHGVVDFFIQIEAAESNYNVGTHDSLWTPLGWSGFRKPHRYSTTAISTTDTQLICWETKRLNRVFQVHPHLGIQFLRLVTQHSLNMMTEVRERLFNYHPIDIDPSLQYQIIGEENFSTAHAPEVEDLLKRSPFFEAFEPHEIEHLTKAAYTSYHLRGEIISRQGDKTDSFMIMGNGKVSLHHFPQEFTQPVSNDIIEQSPIVRSISTVGYSVEYISALENEYNTLTIRVVRDCNIIHIPQSHINDYIVKNPLFGLKFYMRLLWLISTHLRSIRTQLISHEYEREIIAVKNLIDQNCTQLSVKSPLHKLPHLLNHTYTLSDAFDCLKHVNQTGSTLEKGLATVCFEILGNLYRENNFFKGLQDIYHEITHLDTSVSEESARKICAERFIDIFKNVPHIISGTENLPKSANHVFIFNHLVNHSYNTLPNNFQLTLDSHFISSMVLYRKYGDAGIRVVRKSRGIEYGHQDYYGKLGHIDVYTKESDQISETPQQRKDRIQSFFNTAETYINNGVSLILCPEGTSYHTKDSPGYFKAGAFKLAASMDPEPYIIPIAVANFDQRLDRAVLSVVIKPPIKMSEQLNNINDKDAMNAFLLKFRDDYKSYVEEAIVQAQDYHQKPVIQ